MVTVHFCNHGISSIHGKELPEQLSFHREYKRSHIKTNVQHIYKIGVWAIWDLWLEIINFLENHSWKFLSLFGEERIINLQRRKVYVFSASVPCAPTPIRIRISSLRKFFFERFEFLVCSKFNHTHHVAVNVHIHTIPIRMLWCPWRF